jgi:starvation-inducible DNA-binding protein
MKSPLIQKLNQNVSDLQILYVKLHNYHWNVTGPQFLPIHNLTEGYYEHVAGLYDAVAERILQLGEKPFATVAEYLANAKIKEDAKNSFTAEQVLDNVTADFEYLLNAYREIVKLSEESGDITTGNLASETIDWLEKAIWMLKASK